MNTKEEAIKEFKKAFIEHDPDKAMSILLEWKKKKK